jgi:hypothetical protein
MQKPDLGPQAPEPWEAHVHCGHLVHGALLQQCGSKDTAHCPRPAQSPCLKGLCICAHSLQSALITQVQVQLNQRERPSLAKNGHEADATDAGGEASGEGHRGRPRETEEVQVLMGDGSSLFVWKVEKKHYREPRRSPRAEK